MNPATDKGIYLAGDGVSYSGGWTEGALQTAINCATAVAYRLKGKLPSHNALVGQNPTCMTMALRSLGLSRCRRAVG